MEIELLPEGWEERWSERKQRAYWIHKKSGQSVWEISHIPEAGGRKGAGMDVLLPQQASLLPTPVAGAALSGGSGFGTFNALHSTKPSPFPFPVQSTAAVLVPVVSPAVAATHPPPHQPPQWSGGGGGAATQWHPGAAAQPQP